MRRIYLMRSGDPNFYLLTVPPTSIKEVNKSLTRIMASKGIPYTNLIVSLKLAKATNVNGIDYSTVVIEKKGVLPPAAAKMAKEMRNQIKNKYKEMTLSLDEYATTAPGTVADAATTVQAAEGEFVEVNDKDDLPFA